MGERVKFPGGSGIGGGLDAGAPPPSLSVIPAKAGTQLSSGVALAALEKAPERLNRVAT